MTERTIRSDLLPRVREVENVFIPMPDGVRLAARLFLPADGKPAPAIFEYIPYRKRDFMRARDEPMHRWFAAHGFAVARVDVRGTGDSEGVMGDEYTEQEHDDGVAVIEWLSQQSFCDGNVGMMGISWGGFNALQVAARRPPALKAIITLCASDDRYADDAHYMGGCLLNENLQWGSILMTYAAMPPDPQIVGQDRWRDLWMQRLEATVPFATRWSSHQWRDAYWKHGSVCEDFSAIQCPVYVIGGWADGYSNSVGRTLAGLSVPCKGLIGPWAHTFPHRGYPGPAIGFLQEAARWWNHWLRGQDTGIMDEPVLRVWMQDSIGPAPDYDVRPGRWVAETQWPSPRIVPRVWTMGRGTLGSEAPSSSEPLRLRSPALTGAVSGEWCAFGAPGEMPLDQRPDDGRSLVFDSEPLSEPLEILGAPVVELDIASDVPVAMVAVRLNELALDGASTRVSYGLLNLTHRHGHEHPQRLEPGKRERVRVQLNDIAHSFPAGHRLRVAISTVYWPIAWPPPRSATVTVWSKTSSLSLPVRPRHALDDGLRHFEGPEEAPGVQHKTLRPIPFRRTVERDLVTNELCYTLRSDGGEFDDHSHAYIEELDLTLGYSLVKKHWMKATSPLAARTDFIQWVELKRDNWHVRIDTETSTRAEREHLHMTATVRAVENGELVFERTWDDRVPRKLM